MSEENVPVIKIKKKKPGRPKKIRPRGRPPKKRYMGVVQDSIPLVEETDKMNSPGFERDLELDKFKKPDKVWDGKVFRNDFSRLVYYLTRLGANNDHIAEVFGVSTDTVTYWVNNNEDFREAARQGKFMFLTKIVETLGQRALGYSYEEYEEGTALNRAGQIVKVSKKIKKHMPPDVMSLQFILKSQFKEVWGDPKNAMAGISSTKIVEQLKNGMEDNLTEEEKQAARVLALSALSKMQGQSE